MEQNSHYKDNLKTQIREAYARVTYSYTTHLQMMNRLVNKDKNVKYMQIILSAISTGGFVGTLISDEFIMTWVSGLFSTGLLALNLYFKNVNLLENIKAHRTASDNLWFIREGYVSLLTDITVLPEVEIVSKRDSLQGRTHEIYRQSPKADSKSYTDAQKALKFEAEHFFTAEEIDRLLPLHLRNTK